MVIFEIVVVFKKCHQIFYLMLSYLHIPKLVIPLVLLGVTPASKKWYDYELMVNIILKFLFYFS